MHHHDTMKGNAKACLSNRECCVWETVYHILPRLWLKKILPAVYFVNTDLPKERFHVLLSEKKLRELSDPSTNIFKRSYVDRSLKRASATFCNGKYSVFSNFRYAEFLRYYTLENKSDKTCEYQAAELDDNLIKDNQEDWIALILNVKSMISGGTMQWMPQSKTILLISRAK